MVKSLAQGGDRGDPRRRLQPHRRRQPPGADAVDAWHRQSGLLPPAKTSDPRLYLDFTGTGNSMNVRHPHVLQLIMDSLRYWHVEMHVDGFRFDLASALARELFEVDRLSAFFDIIQQDPVISQVKLIAEPWDVGDGGYQVGNFPPRWSEWNGQYRDTIRDLWRGEEATLSEFGYRFTGSSDLYEAAHPQADGVGQLRHVPRRFHAHRPGVVQRKAQRRPTARTTATANRTTARGTTGSRARPTIPRSSRCGPASGATWSPRCCCRRACR